ncbi:hypothetical protein [Paenibacillus silviterrae]|nr:hypothetical protein [Paenibacillus chinjuensis]
MGKLVGGKRIGRIGKERLQHISGYAGKLLRQKFGRGPDPIFAYAG